jgi:DNA-binding NtrC family response regulator
MVTILLVDDDPLQASLMMSFLGRRFGEVLRVAGAAEALCLIEQPGFASKLGLVISAHHTPGIGGPTFIAELHTRMPNMPVLVLGTRSEVAADYSSEPVVFLPQPVVAEQMLTFTARILAAQKNVAEQKNVLA